MYFAVSSTVNLLITTRNIGNYLKKGCRTGPVEVRTHRPLSTMLRKPQHDRAGLYHLYRPLWFDTVIQMIQRKADVRLPTLPHHSRYKHGIGPVFMAFQYLHAFYFQAQLFHHKIDSFLIFGF